MSRQHRSDLLTDRETFERYERPASTNYNPPTHNYNNSHGQLACEYRQAPPQPGPRTTSHNHGQLACEYRRGPDPKEPGLACEYRQAPPSRQDHLACEYRQESRIEDYPNAKGPTTIRTYLPHSNNRRIPLGLVVGIAIAVPILIIVILFGAVWLQELGIL